ncbi:MAG TPA: TonB-dependent receptor [Chitinophagaceae bacterium]|nr:TonB-dependent receptor [Chitinophagaceae bacterium]
MAKKITFAGLLFIITFISFSQTGKIEGYISDAENRTPLNGATVIVANKKGDNTDAFGKFSISGINPGQYELVVSHISYKTEIIPIEVKENLISSVSVAMKKANIDLTEVRINGKKGSPLNTIGSVDVMLRPVNNSQDVLRIVPGLFIAQHAGGGKAEQIFVRGYDIDHGTDINVTVDGMPVNMVSHAHGQGYADLHFLIPETVEKVNFDKGPYFTNKGNLATAGYAEFHTKEFLKENFLKFEGGQFNTQRLVGMLKILNTENEDSRQQFFIGSEYFKSDGYFESPQNFHRFNMIGKYNAWFGNQSQLTITASTFDSKWNASGQVPDRAVERGMISRFGSIDDSEGGNTSRTNINIRFAKQWTNNWKTTDQLYYSRSHFNLFSNFTFFLDDAINGDEINQRESRNIYGINKTASKSWLLGNRNTTTEFGGGFRCDDVMGIELSRAVKRQFLDYVQNGNIKETNTHLYWNQSIDFANKVNINGGLRFDYFSFAYRNILAGETGFRHQQRGILSPKLNFVYTPSSTVTVFLNNGIGFHSNDTRVILDNSAKDILPRVFGTDLGLILKPVKNLILRTALWHFYSEQEFVYVGDAGMVEPGGKTRRAGVDISARYQFTSWLFGDLDMNYTKARGIGAAKDEDYIPLAPSFTSTGGISAKMKNGFSGSLRYRFMDHRPANEFNSVKAEGYFINEISLAYAWKKFEVTFSAENIFNREWREAQFDTESRLQFEPGSVSEIHYTPGTPRFLKAGIHLKF